MLMKGRKFGLSLTVGKPNAMITLAIERALSYLEDPASAASLLSFFSCRTNNLFGLTLSRTHACAGTGGVGRRSFRRRDGRRSG